ncbi:MaoC family dehydratase [Paraburkholderia bengalensis]|uniref:MaoC family dehydratase n=1 Tax=Paraburkholderia bengalensis TaxID=2747562 RepID=A0ABU8IZF1_9BURK
MPLSQFDRPPSDRYFEDYVPGLTYEFGPISADEEDIINFAKTFDPQYIHTDPVAAANGPFHGLIASGWHTASLITRLFIEHFLTSVASLASPGLDEIRWLSPVRPGDQLRLQVAVVDKRISRSKPDRGLVYTPLEGRNDKGELVITMKGINFVRVRP